MFWSPQRLVKDDVFLAPLITAQVGIKQVDDNTNNIPTPCLSPVTSPSDFLYNHEPLFDDTDDDGYYSEQEDEAIKAPHLVTNKTISPFVPNKTKRKIITSETNQSKKLKATHPTTLFENLTQSGIDWCRYCGTTEGVNWRPGPWGKRTLCNKHGCDYKGYGLASRLPRLDLSAFAKEKLEDRKRPIVQQFCVICQCPEKSEENKLVPCEGGCSRAYHQNCHSVLKLDSSSWYCSPQCQENKDKNRVVVDLPRKYLPLMHLHRQQRKLLSTKNMDDQTVQKKSSHFKSK
ncbi:MAG: hypothetical protein EXX96DRAFT_516519 [Benjaminiella poitrasii]|nr:MAG: hypothetical protein EXX96DRAFT_516519 [Benjaminiella poitrasii]